ncbi:hypothetical protein FKW77_008047 [Venturia effusa]|uniref:CENP-V/GFA domain-containing protein n=1 Tax=Venturia effusa TaxID=50376 RepID=A0A517KWX3_9PEZI|nr:hypothetical protein FKW77_008047 [Venturia effusa]
MSNKGGCFCGSTRISYDGDAKMKALCHCLDCRKISGSTYSTNIIVDDSSFKVQGTPKEISKTADGGNTITSYFCPDCGTTLFRKGKTFEGKVIIKAGVMDDVQALEAAKPTAELFTEHRVGWVPETAGAQQMKGMGS